jgi:hypothetical protein
MAQGTIKKLGVKPTTTKPNPAKTRKGARVTKPKKATSSDKMQKKLSAGIVARTEKLLGERAGHLEMIGKGRDKSVNKKGGDGKAKGGSRKFG